MYATVQDVRDRIGADDVRGLADDALAETPSWSALEAALADASEEIDGYIAARHSLPLDPVPGALKRICIQIAVYLRCGSADLAAEQHKERADAARRFLRDVAKGLVSLGPADPDPPAAAADPAVSVDAAPRVMARKSLQGVL